MIMSRVWPLLKVERHTDASPTRVAAVGLSNNPIEPLIGKAGAAQQVGEPDR